MGTIQKAINTSMASMFAVQKSKEAMEIAKAKTEVNLYEAKTKRKRLNAQIKKQKMALQKSLEVREAAEAQKDLINEHKQMLGGK